LHQARKDKPSLKDLYFVATRLQPSDDESLEVVFGVENYPNVKIADAFCASTALPPVYEPVMVTEKGGRKIGFCNDGGVVNNFPVGIFDHNMYCEPHYKLQFIRYRDNATPYAVNPCTMGFSLISHLAQLNQKITPLSARLKSLIGDEAVTPVVVTPPPLVATNPTWGHWDIIRLAIIYKFGRLEPEDSERKYRTHPENIIQIYAEEVDTTEFDLADDKCERLIDSGRHAFNLWYDYFRNVQEHYTGDYVIKLPMRPEQEQLKERDPIAFHTQKAARHLQALFEELARYPEASADEIRANLRIQLICFKIQLDIKKLTKHTDSRTAIHAAYQAAGEQHQAYVEKLWHDRNHLNKLIQSDRVGQHLSELLLDADKNPGAFKRFLRAQLGRALYFCLEHDAPLMALVASKQISMMPFIMKLLQEKLDHFWQLGSPFPYTLIQMLHQMPGAPLLQHANQNSDEGALRSCLKYGLNPLQKDTQGKTALHHAIDIGNVKAFCTYLEHLHALKTDIGRVCYGLHQQPLAHYLLAHQDEKFLRAVMTSKQGDILKGLLNQSVDSAGIHCFEYFSYHGDVSAWANFVQLADEPKAHKYSEERKSYFEKTRVYSETLEKAKTSLYLANYISPDKLQDIEPSALLGLLGQDAANNIILLSIEKHWNSVVTQAFEILIAAGFEQEVECFIHNPTPDYTLHDFAAHHQNQDIMLVLNRSSANEADSLKMEELDTLEAKSPMVLNQHRIHLFHQLIKTGTLQQMLAHMEKVLVRGIDELIGIFHEMDFAHKTPLHYMIDGCRKDLFDGLIRYLIEKELLGSVLDVHKRFGEKTLLEYAHAHHQGFYEKFMEMEPKASCAVSCASVEGVMNDMERLKL
jgi:Patatin-like phospholipase